MEFPLDETEERLHLIMELLPPIGRGLLAFQNEVHISNSDSHNTDHVLMKKSDQYVEHALLEKLRGRFPDDTIISEDAGQSGGDGEFQWYIDPVDGTRNFIHGVPMFSIAVGICFRGSPIAGAIYLPAFNDTYHAVSGQGAYKNHVPISTSGVNHVNRTLVSNGLPYYRTDIIPEILGNISAFITSGIGLRRTGAGTVDICWIAEGRFDAMWERDMDPWDLCGASVILQEAGGEITGIKGEEFDLKMRDILASNSKIHHQLIDILKETTRVQGFN